MKVRSFNNDVPPFDGNPAISKSAKSPSNNNETRRIAGKDKSQNQPQADGIGSSKRIGAGCDRIELSANAADLSGRDNPPSAVYVQPSPELKNRFQDTVYSPQSVANGVGEVNNMSGDGKLTRIRRNIAEGYYDSPEFMEKLAEKLIEEFYLPGEKN